MENPKLDISTHFKVDFFLEDVGVYIIKEYTNR